MAAWCENKKPKQNTNYIVYSENTIVGVRVFKSNYHDHGDP